MKKLYPLLVIILLLSTIAILFISMAKNDQPITIVQGNTAQIPLPLKLNHTNDPYCKMIITQKANSLQVVSPKGETWFFDDIGCMVLWIEDKSFKEVAKIWIYDPRQKAWVDARKAHYSDIASTPMGYGFGVDSQKSLSYEEVVLRMLRGQTLLNPKIRKKLLGE